MLCAEENTLVSFTFVLELNKPEYMILFLLVTDVYSSSSK